MLFYIYALDHAYTHMYMRCVLRLLAIFYSFQLFVARQTRMLFSPTMLFLISYYFISFSIEVRARFLFFRDLENLFREFVCTLPEQYFIYFYLAPRTLVYNQPYSGTSCQPDMTAKYIRNIEMTVFMIGISISAPST